MSRSLCLYRVSISMEELKTNGDGLSLLWLRFACCASMLLDLSSRSISRLDLDDV